MRTGGTVPCDAGRTVGGWERIAGKRYGVSALASTRAAQLRVRSQWPIGGMAVSRDTNVGPSDVAPDPTGFRFLLTGYSWITSGVPTFANSQNQAASAGSIPIQP